MTAEDGHGVAFLNSDGHRVQQLFCSVLPGPQRQMLCSRAADDVEQLDGIRSEDAARLSHEGQELRVVASGDGRVLGALRLLYGVGRSQLVDSAASAKDTESVCHRYVRQHVLAGVDNLQVRPELALSLQAGHLPLGLTTRQQHRVVRLYSCAASWGTLPLFITGQDMRHKSLAEYHRILTAREQVSDGFVYSVFQPEGEHRVHT